MQIYNTDSYNSNQRFIKAILIGIVSGIVMGILYGLLYRLVRIQMEILYIMIGAGIGELVQKYSHGVGRKFQVTSALCTLLAIIIGDLMASGAGQFLLYPSMWLTGLRVWMRLYLSTSLTNLLGIIFRGIGIYAGYRNGSLF